MKRPLLFSCVLCTVLGLLLGVLLPVDWAGKSQGAAANSSINFSVPAESSKATVLSPAKEGLDASENFPLLNTACLVNLFLHDRDYTALAGYVHPERGVTFTPYSTVDFDRDLTFMPEHIRTLDRDKSVYTWGIVDGRGTPIRMTMVEYLERYVYNKDYTQAREIGVDQIMTGGNALENLTDAYPGCRFVDFCIPSTDPVNDGLDWSSLKLVFEPLNDSWYLVGIVHGEWTI